MASGPAADDGVLDAQGWESDGDNAGSSAQASSDERDDTAKEASATAPPMQKRRRVTRACDECRRKKIKCDGKQPCTHCTVYSYECTYDQPSNRRRNAAPQYIEALEKRLKRMEAILNVVLPNVDYNDPNVEAAIRRGGLKSRANPMAGAGGSGAGPAPAAAAEGKANGVEAGPDSQLESMVKATGQLDLDEEGHWDYHGLSSGFSFVHRMREQFPGFIPEPAHATFFHKMRPNSGVMHDSPKFDSPRSNLESPLDSSFSPTADLPPRDTARQFVDMAINDATSLLRFVHEPTIWKSFDRIYDLSPEQYGNDDNVFLPLLYAMLALGSLFSRDADELDNKGYGSALDEGFKYFRAARQLIDIVDCRDIRSLQAIVFMIVFLQSSAKLSTCYTYIGAAYRSSLRMGMHRNFSGSFNPIENETRKRVFWVICKMDIYVGALLGLPYVRNHDEVDQEYPTEVNDEYITETEILPMPEGTVSVIAAANAHTDLVKIISKIVTYIYPMKGTSMQSPNTNGGPIKSYSVSYAKIREIEMDLQEWMQNLPMGLRPGGDAPTIILRVQQLLRTSLAHAQMMLYRPFLHYVSHTCKSKVVDKRSYACAAACVSVSRNIIHITIEMNRRGLLCGAHWFTMYTSFFAILSLLFFALENPDNPTSQEVLRDAKGGKETLQQLARRSLAADRCSTTLTTAFAQLPERLKRARPESISAKKRRQEPDTQASNLSHLNTALEGSQPRRAGTFPLSGAVDGSQQLSQQIPLAQAHLGLDSPYNYSPTSQLTDTNSHPTPSSASTSAIPFNLQPHRNAMAGLGDGGLGGLPPSPTVVTNFGDPNMPLPDLTSMMFPSGDPFAYPNQPAMLGAGGGGAGGAFAPKDFSLFPTGGDAAAAEDAAMQGAAFIPPSSTFMPRNNSGAQGDADVQLFGPVPMYQMQGLRSTSFSGGNGGIGGGGGGGAPDFGNAFAANIREQGGGANGDAQQGAGAVGASAAPAGADQLGQNSVAGMNLDELFGGEEWAGMFDPAGGGFGGGAGRDQFELIGASFR